MKTSTKIRWVGVVCFVLGTWHLPMVWFLIATVGMMIFALSIKVEAREL